MLLLLLPLPPPPPRSAGRGAGRRLGSGRCARPGGVCGDIYSQAPPPALPRAAGRPGGGGDERGWLPLPDPGPDRPRGCTEHREPRGRRGPSAPGVCAARSSVSAIPRALGAARPAWRAPRVCAAPRGPPPVPAQLSRVMRRQLVRIGESAPSRPGVPTLPFLPRAALGSLIAASCARAAAAGWLRPSALPRRPASRCSAGPLRAGSLRP